MDKCNNIFGKLMPCLIICWMFVFMPGIAQDFPDENHENMFSNMDETASHDIISLLRQEEDQFSIFLGLIEKTGMEKSLREAEDLTVFAPTNEAFKEMSVRRYERLMEADDLMDVKNFVRAHIIPQSMTISEFQTEQALEISENQHVRIIRGGGQGFGSPLVLNVGGARVGRGDIRASNGVLHVMNGVVRFEEERADNMVNPR